MPGPGCYRYNNYSFKLLDICAAQSSLCLQHMHVYHVENPLINGSNY